jgi:hypothetical protein
MPARQYASFLLALPRQQLRLREETWVVTGGPDPRLGVADGDMGLTASLNKASANGWVLESVLMRDSSSQAVVVLSGTPGG